MVFKKALVGVLVGSFALVLAGDLPRAGRLDTMSQWVARYRVLQAQMNAKDVTAFESGFHESFVYVDAKKKRMNRDQFFKMVEGMFASADKVSAKIKVLSVKNRGPYADVKFDFRAEFAHKPSGATTLHEVGTDTWKNFGGKWLCVKTVDRVFTMKSTKR